MFRRSRSIGLWAALLLGTLRCGASGVSGPPVVGETDAGADSAGASADAGSDAGATADAGSDVGATADAGSDAGGAGADAGTPSGSDGGSSEPSACHATPLCGPPERPCLALDNDLLPGEGKQYFFGEAFLALDPEDQPMVVYGPSLFDGTQLRHFVTRSADGSWTEHPLPFKYPSSFINDAQGRGFALSLADDFSANVSLWRWEAGQWTQDSTFTGGFKAGTFAVDSHERFYKLMGDASLASFDGTTWRTTDLGTPGKWQIYRGLALSRSGRPEYLYQEAANGVWLNRWISPPAPPEEPPVLIDRAPMAVTAGASGDALGEVHILGWRYLWGFQPYELAYARRTGPNTWESFSLAQAYTSDPWDYCGRCRGDACDNCVVETEDVTAAAVLSNGCDDDVRLLYVRSWNRPSCRNLPSGATACVGARLELAWVTSAGAQTAVISPEWSTAGAEGISAAVDRDGFIHVAFQDYNRAAPPLFHYFRLGPASSP